MFHFYTPWKRQKTKSFLTFSGAIEMEYRAKMVQIFTSARLVLRDSPMLAFFY